MLAAPDIFHCDSLGQLHPKFPEFLVALAVPSCSSMKLRQDKAQANSYEFDLDGGTGADDNMIDAR